MRNREKGIPGVMLYFDTECLFENLSSDDGMALIRAMIKYAKTGQVPELDGVAKCVWPMLESKIDRDKETYEVTREKRKYSTYVRDCRRNETEPLQFNQWRSIRGDNVHQMMSHDIT